MFKSNSSGGVGFVGLLTILFVGLKLTGFIAWSWWWVLAPVWITIALAFLVEENPDWFEKEEPTVGMTASPVIRQLAGDSKEFKEQLLKDIEWQRKDSEKRAQANRKAPAYRWPLGRKDEWGVTNTLWSEQEAKLEKLSIASDDTHEYQWPALPDKDGFYPGPK